MARQSVLSQLRKKPGPAATGKGTLIGVRLQPPALAAVDEWASKQEDQPSRPEAIRRMIELVLSGGRKKRP
jgi:hypothetical protein